MADVAEERRVLYVEVHGEENDGLQFEVGPARAAGRARWQLRRDVPGPRGLPPPRLLLLRRPPLPRRGPGLQERPAGQRPARQQDEPEGRGRGGPGAEPVRHPLGRLRKRRGRGGSGAPAAAAAAARPAAGAAAPPAGRWPSLVFAVLASVHWGFGAGSGGAGDAEPGETRQEAPAPGRRLAWAGLALGLAGGLLNGWFTEGGAPPARRRRRRLRAAGAGRTCADIGAALARYRAAHGGLLPAEPGRPGAGGPAEAGPDALPRLQGRRASQCQYAYLPPAPGAPDDPQRGVIVWDSRRGQPSGRRLGAAAGRARRSGCGAASFAQMTLAVHGSGPPPRPRRRPTARER